MYKNELLSIQLKEVLQKAKERYSKEKVAEYYSKRKKQEKKSQKIDIKTCQRKKKVKLKNTKEKDISNWFNITKKHHKIWVLFLLSIRMSEKTLKFNNIRLDKKEFHKSK